MTLDMLNISASVALWALSIVLLSGLIMTARTLGRFNHMMERLQGQIEPLAVDMKIITVNLAAVSDSLRAGMQQVDRFGETLGQFGEDLELGRNAIRGTWKLLANPWLAKLRMFGPK